ncbi:MAG: hypothetical protein AAGA29_03915 [Planctomycetota bacterium]
MFYFFDDLHRLAWMVLATVALLLGLGSFTGCGGGGEAGGEDPASDTVKVDDGEEPSIDSDGDGLPDDLEAELGTSPFLADTDFDGYEDGEEVLSMGFDGYPEPGEADRPGRRRNPYRFNPRIADVPRLEVRIADVPQIYITHTMTDSSTQSFDNSRSVENSTGFTTTSGGSNSLRGELSATVGSRVSATAGVNAGVTAEVNASVTASLAEENTMNWSDTQTRGHRDTVSESRGFSATNDVTQSGGRVEVAVNLRNTGNVAYTLRTLALGLRKYDPIRRRMIEVGQLEPESDQVFTGITSLSPGELVDGMVFRAVLELEEAELLLGEGPMIVRTLHYELQDMDSRSFDHRDTHMLANTVTVTLDRGDGRPPETHFVSAFSPDGEGVSFDQIVGDILGLRYELGTELWRFPDGMADTQPGLLELDGLAMDPALGTYWVVEIVSDTGRGIESEFFNPLHSGIDLAELRLGSNQSLRLLYITDADRDGLGTRTEQTLGLDPTKFDTDGDGVGDGDELLAGTDPRHGVASAELVSVNAMGTTLGVRMRVRPPEDGAIDGVTIDWGDGSTPEHLPMTIEARRHAAEVYTEYTTEHTYAEFGEYTLTLTPHSTEGPTPPRRTRVRLASALVPGAEIDLPEGSVMPDIATGPTGEIALRYYNYLVEEEAFGDGHLAMFDRFGQPVWDAPLPTIPDGMQRELANATGMSQSVAVGPRGVVYAISGGQVHAYDRRGQRQWSVIPVNDRNQEVRPFAVVASADGRVFSAGSQSPGSPPFISRLTDGATLAWTAFPETTRRGESMLAVRPGGVWFANPEMAMLIDDAGQIVGEPISHNYRLTALNATPAGGFTLGGNQHGAMDTSAVPRATCRSGVWSYSVSGTLVWGYSSPPAQGYVMLRGMETDRAGDVYTLSIRIPTTHADGGLQLQDPQVYADGIEAVLAVFSPEGQLRFRENVAWFGPEVGLAALLFPVSIAVGEDGVWVAWTEFENVVKPEVGEAPGSFDCHVRMVRWDFNPRPTAILYEE